MALFELENGRLVPAQFGHDVPDGFTDEVLEAIRSQVLEIVSRPLFPIAWSTEGRSKNSECSRLTGLDASGQVVAVEVMRRLDADILIDSLSRLSDTASLSWADLARTYPLGPEGFRREWVAFREAMPPSPPNGPRLILVTSEIAEEVRPALDVLSSSGIEVHQMALRQMANGRAFLDVEAVGPRIYGHRANTLLETSAILPVIEAGPAAEDVEPTHHGRHSDQSNDAHEFHEVPSPAPLAVPPVEEEELTRHQVQAMDESEEEVAAELQADIWVSGFEGASSAQVGTFESQAPEQVYEETVEQFVVSQIGDLETVQQQESKRISEESVEQFVVSQIGDLETVQQQESERISEEPVEQIDDAPLVTAAKLEEPVEDKSEHLEEELTEPFTIAEEDEEPEPVPQWVPLHSSPVQESEIPLPSRRSLLNRGATEPARFPSRRSLFSAQHADFSPRPRPSVRQMDGDTKEPPSDVPLPSRAQRHHTEIPEVQPQPGISDLALIAGAAGGDVTLYLRAEQRTPEGAKLTSDGLISVPSGHYQDPTDALQGEGIWAADGWNAWRLASPEGPSLADALEEIKRWS